MADSAVQIFQVDLNAWSARPAFAERGARKSPTLCVGLSPFTVVGFILVYLFMFIFLILIVISPIPFFFLLYSTVTQLHIHVYILFSHIVLLQHK